MTALVPVVDLAADPAVVAAQIGEACARIGFFQIVHHGVADDIVDAGWASTRAFFDEPLDIRQSVAVPHAGYPYGYIGFEVEALASSLGDVTPPDRKHTYSFGPLDAPAVTPSDPDEIWVRSPNRWPSARAGFREALERYYRAMADLAAELLGHMAVALDLAPKYFAPMIDRHVSALRCLDYPALDTAPLPGQLRAGAHTDYGTLTILRTAPGSNGLQAQDVSGTWTPIMAEAGGFVVNIGDSLAQWTNDRWRSTMHRVVEPPDAERRTSMAFFHNANWDARIECLPGAGEPKYAPVLAGRHLMSKFHRTVGA
ncbi:MAG: putative oxidoreductase [Ilumatobacteraceae bacterium]|nr:putative oxidoreductase [Ilumatobacteraceae bacterium]